MIKTLHIIGFMGIKERKLEFSKTNKITWFNGAWKTTIKNAITFVLFWKINNSSLIDESINIESQETKVIMAISLNSKNYLIERTKKEKGNEIKLNWKIITQNELETSLWISYMNFVSVFCLWDFMKFPINDRRSLLLSILGNTDRIKMWKDRFKHECTYDLNDLEGSLVKAKDKVNLIKNKVLGISNRKEYLNNEINSIKAKLSISKQKKFPYDILKHEGFKNAVYNHKQLEPKLEDYISGIWHADLSDINNDITKLEIKKNEIIRNKPNDHLITNNKIEYARLWESLNSLKGSTNCPTCKRAYEWKMEWIKEELALIENKRVKLLNETKKLIGEHEQNTKDYTNALANLESELSRKRSEVINSSTKYSKDVDTAKSKYYQDKEAHTTNWSELLRSLAEYDAVWNLNRTINTEIDLLEWQIADKEKEYTTLSSDLTILWLADAENEVKFFWPSWIQLMEIKEQLSKLSPYLIEWLELRLIVQNKTNDNVKQVFDVVYNGIEYDWLSTWIKMKVDICLSKLVWQRTSLEMYFIDNTESYTWDLPTEYNQIFLCKVSSEDFELKI